MPFPATAIVALRVTPVMFCATLNDVDPLPRPFVPAVSLIHETGLEDDQKQVSPVVMEMTPSPPAAGMEALTGETE